MASQTAGALNAQIDAFGGKRSAEVVLGPFTLPGNIDELFAHGGVGLTVPYNSGRWMQIDNTKTLANQALDILAALR
jgi:hypothetical protein